MYLFKYHACPPVDGNSRFDLDNPQNLRLVLDEISRRIEKMKLNYAHDSAKLDVLLDMNTRDRSSGASLSQFEQDAGLVLNVLAGTDMITRHYYEVYPKYRPMLDMVNNLAKIVPASLRIVFGEELPSDVKTAFPYASVLFADYAAAYG